jgi:hypothetical protein
MCQESNRHFKFQIAIAGIFFTVNQHFTHKSFSLFYWNEIDQRVARQQLCKHGPKRNKRGGCVLRVPGDVTQPWVVDT